MSIRNGHVRWAFDLKAWRCTLDDLQLATACVQPEEKERLAAFVYLDDFKASLIGRLLMRRFIKACLPELDYNAIHFDRDSRGKPFYEPSHTDKSTQINFNVSHHERYAIIAGSVLQNPDRIITQNVGVDLMNTKYSGGKPLQEFFRIMQRTFTPNEWKFIRAQSTEQQQAAAFMRNWCLKESYVKNIGVGVTIDLRSIDFRINTKHLNQENIIRNTVAAVDGQLLNDWIFEESMLDDEHCVGVSVKDPSRDYLELSENELLFEIIDFKTLIQDAAKIRPLLTIDTEYCQKILAKELKKTL